MMKLSSEQMKALRELNRVPYKEISPDDKIYVFLQKEEFITRGYQNKTKGRVFCVEITEKGKSFLATNANDNKRVNISIFLSIVALVISLISLINNIYG